MTRRERWLKVADRALVDRTATETGVEVRFRPDPEVFAELNELAALEADCCGFARWKVSQVHGAVRLQVETDRAKAPTLWAMFDEALPAPRSSPSLR